MYSEQVNKFFADLITWAKQSSDVKAIAVVGSYARNQQKADSDIDLIIIVSEVEKLFNDTKWLSNFGSYVDKEIEDYGLITSLRVFYSFAEVEFGIGTKEWIEAGKIEGETKQVIDSGFKSLYNPLKLFE